MVKRNYYKHNDGDLVWWVDTPGEKGLFLFSFDKETVFNFFRDYPHALTSEQKRVFDEENPLLAKLKK